MRRSCQTIAGASASPVRRLQNRIVSRWLAIPSRDPYGPRPRRRRLGEARPTPDIRGVMIDPARLRWMAPLLCSVARHAPRPHTHRPSGGRAFVEREGAPVVPVIPANAGQFGFGDTKTAGFQLRVPSKFIDGTLLECVGGPMDSSPPRRRRVIPAGDCSRRCDARGERAAVERTISRPQVVCLVE